MTTEERLERIERELSRAKRRNRWLLAAMGLTAGFCALTWIVARSPRTAQVQAAGTADGIIRASGFIVVDENGKDRAKLAAFKDGTALHLYDENGTPRAALGVVKDEPLLALYDENGKGRAALSVEKDGPLVSLYDENGKPRARLGADKDGPLLGLFDENRKPRAALGVFKEGAMMGLKDENGKTIWQAPR